MLKKLSKPKLILIIILLLTIFFRFFRLDYPNTYVFDEVYHAFTAKEYLIGDKDAWVWWTTPPPGVAYEWTHPPLAKEIMALSMYILHTTNPWAWRVPGAFLGVLTVWLVYLITKKLFKSEAASLMASFAFSLDGLNFVQSRTGMNDIYMVIFMLCCVLFMIDKKYFISAIFLGLSLASKWTGLYLLGFIFVLLFLLNPKDKAIRITLAVLAIFGGFLELTAKLTNLFITMGMPQQSASYDSFMNAVLIPFLLNPWLHLTIAVFLALYMFFVPSFRKIGVYILVPAIIYLATYIPIFLLGFDYKIFTGLQQQMWWYHTNLKATHDYASSWWSWPFNLYPVWYYVQYYDNGTLSNIFASGNPILYIIGSFAIIGTVWAAVGKKLRILIACLFGLIILFLFGLLIKALNSPLSLITNLISSTIATDSLILIGAIFLLVSFWMIYKDRQRNLFITVFGFLVFWLPWALSPRIMFLYHFTPSVPFLCIILGYQLNQILLSKDKQLILPTNSAKTLTKNFKIKSEIFNQNYLTVFSILLLMFIAFLLLYPVLTGIPLEKSQLIFFFRTNLTKDPFGLGS